MANDLRRAHDEIELARESAESVVRKQLESIDQGVFEEAGGNRTQQEPGPKADRIAEIEEKLAGLEDEAGEPTSTHIAHAREHLRGFRDERAEE